MHTQVTRLGEVLTERDELKVCRAATAMVLSDALWLQGRIDEVVAELAAAKRSLVISTCVLSCAVCIHQ